MRAILLGVFVLIAFALMSDLGRVTLEISLAISLSIAFTLALMIKFSSKFKGNEGDKRRNRNQAQGQPADD